MSTPLRRLIDLPGVADLEFKAVMKPAMREPGAPADYPEIDECARAVFGLTADEAEAIQRPADWDGIEHKPMAEQVAAFEAAGWDVTDNKRKPLKLFEHFNQPLWLAVRGVAGTLPFQAEAKESGGGWVSKLEAEASRFRKR